jgi:hypothetical protein
MSRCQSLSLLCRGALRNLCVYLGKRGEVMYQIYALLGLMCFMWVAAIYASYAGEPLPKPFPPTI